MISDADLIDIINEVHQYSMIILELREKEVYGIYRTAEGRTNYFRVRAPLDAHPTRRELVETIYSGKPMQFVESISLDQLLSGLGGKRTRHIWLERYGREPSEMAFVSIRELRHYLKGHPI